MKSKMCIKSIVSLLALLTLSARAADFKTLAKPFLEKYCLECHDSDTQKGDVALHELTGVTAKNAELWKQVWEQVALKEMPPRKKKNQPDSLKRLEISDWITSELSKALKSKGGFTDHMRPIKGNHIDHDLLFKAPLKNLEPSYTPARIWRIHPQAQLVRLNDLICREPEFNPNKPGMRTKGDRIVPNLQGELKVYFGLDRYIGHVGGTAAYAASVTGFPLILSESREHGLRNYPFMYSVNSSEATQTVSVAEQVLRFMAYGPDAEPYQFADKVGEIPAQYKHESKRGLPTGIFYSKETKRPITPLYHLMKEDGVSESRLIETVQFLFEKLTLRQPTKAEVDNYLSIAKESILKLGKKDGVILGLAPIFLDRDALFRPELAEYGTPDKYGRVMLQGDELVLAINSAFSFIMPDDKLKQALKDGKLKTREDVKREITRILNDDSIRKPQLLQFFKEFFDYDISAGLCKDEKALAAAGGSKGTKHYASMNSMVANTDRLIELILQEDKNVFKELLTTNRVIYSGGDEVYFGSETRTLPVLPKKKKAGKKKNDQADKEFEAKKKAYNQAHKSFMNETFPGKEKSIFVRVSQFIHKDKAKSLTEVNPKERMGILTHPSWLISHSDAMDNHAILRGRWIRERLLGDAVPDVPITVDAMLPDEPKETLRHRMRVTREDECWRCHRKMDPLGLPFEMFNHIGKYREKEKGKPVDTTGEIIYSGDPALDGKVSNALEMIKKLAASERVEQVFVRHVFRYWMGRNENINDAPILRDAHKAYKESGGSMKALLISLLTSDAFLYRKVIK